MAYLSEIPRYEIEWFSYKSNCSLVVIIYLDLYFVLNLFFSTIIRNTNKNYALKMASGCHLVTWSDVNNKKAIITSWRCDFGNILDVQNRTVWRYICLFDRKQSCLVYHEMIYWLQTVIKKMLTRVLFRHPKWSQMFHKHLQNSMLFKWWKIQTLVFFGHWHYICSSHIVGNLEIAAKMQLFHDSYVWDCEEMMKCF